MTGHQINSLVGDLVAMAHAMEKLPQVEAELQERDNECAKHLDTIQDRELRILDLKAELEAKSNTIRELEVAKDAAETMFLEADDRTTRALEFVKAQFGAAGSLIQALEPPRAEPPKVEQTVEAAVPQGVRYYDLPKDEPQPEPVVSEVKPIAADPTLATETIASTPAVSDTTVSELGGASSAPQGQSEPGPTVSESLQDSSQTATTVQEPDGAMASPGPYSNKRYYDHPIYVSLDDWLAGGGTETDYHWRPSHDYGKDSPF